MKTKKIVCLVLAIVLIIACGAAVLSACGKKEDKTIIIWGPAEHKDIYLAWAEKFQQEHLDMLEGYTFSFAGSGDANAYASMNVDPTTGAAVYTFANDQAANLRNLGALAKTTGTNLEWSQKNNSEAAVEATKLGADYYGYPLQADNGYFMYYNKAAFKGATFANKNGEIQPGYTFRDMFDWLAQTNNKSSYKNSKGDDVELDWSKSKVTWALGTSWYMSGIFFSVGGDYSLVYDDTGKQTSADCWFADDGSGKYQVGMAAYEATKNTFTTKGTKKVDPHYDYTQNIDDYLSAHVGVDQETAREVPLAAAVCGTWRAKFLQNAWGEDYGATVLPVLETDSGDRYQMKTFAGYKNMGVNPLCSFVKNGKDPKEQAARLSLLHEFAQYLCGTEISLERYKATGAGPANNDALKDPDVASDIALNALNAQYALECVYPEGYSGKEIYYTFAEDGSSVKNEREVKGGDPVGNGLGYRSQDSVPANYWSPIENIAQLMWSEFSSGEFKQFLTKVTIQNQLKKLQEAIQKSSQ